MAYQHANKTSATSQPDDIIPDTIEVTGEDVSNTEVLELYFQGAQSGGKREKKIEWIKHVDKGIVHVKFLSSEGKKSNLSTKILLMLSFQMLQLWLHKKSTHL